MLEKASLEELKDRWNKNNELLTSMASEILENNLDIYSYVASKLFNVTYEDCIHDSPVGYILRSVARKLCLDGYDSLGNHSDLVVNKLSESYSIPDLANRLISAFPYTKLSMEYKEIERYEKIRSSAYFLHSLTWHVNFCRLMSEQEAMNKEYFETEDK